MIKWSRLWAVFKARNLEFFRDRSSLAWNIAFPVLLLVIFSIAFSGDGRAVYKVGVMAKAESSHPFLQTRFIDFIDYQHIDKAMIKLDQHEIDLIVDDAGKAYWVNENSPKSYMVEKIFLADSLDYQRQVTRGEPIRYIDWVLPGIFAMNMMFSCLFGVGYVIVRYRKNSVLKRLKATPLSALEFVGAQLLSRLFIVLFMAAVVYIGCNWIFDFIMLGSYLDLFLIAVIGAVSLISMGLLIATRSKSEELVGGLLNMATWPMMLLSGVWFSLEGAPGWVKTIADILPLTHLVGAGRRIITEGATLNDVSYSIIWLLSFTLICLLLSSRLFSWDADR
ncbi:ABC transporter permease [Thalassotalea sp. HSM 43]|uniref:ABC transporter permease n=1 Tax=Thalassotalea sp. HSM 43 TaxID=2552945 RepID=UPI0010801FB5|nr:ABC transporter permease [Thalassotalea sp. HSM 43]QBY03609.1 ABC transporter permease [Thalassotalea sp. HSM 43]